MSWIQTIDESDARGRLKEVYSRIRGSRGKVSNIFKVQSLDPRSLGAHLDFYLSIMFGAGGLGRAQREMIAVAVSSTNECQYCVAHHSEALAKYVKDERFIKKLARSPSEAKLEPKDRTMLAYVVKLTKTPRLIAEQDIMELQNAGFNDQQILQIATVASYFNFVNRLASGLGVRLEDEGGTGYRY